MTVQPGTDSSDTVFTVQRDAIEGRIVRLVTRSSDDPVVDFTAEIDRLPDTCGLSDVAIYDAETLDALAAVALDLQREYRELTETASDA